MMKYQDVNEIFLREVQKRIYVQTSSKIKWWNVLLAGIILLCYISNPSFLNSLFLFFGVCISLYDTSNFIIIKRDIGIRKMFEVTFKNEIVKVVANDKLEVMIILADQDKQVSMDDIKEVDYVIV